jgi:hypothetical protein
MTSTRKLSEPPKPSFFAAPDGLDPAVRAEAVAKGMTAAAIDVLTSAAGSVYVEYGSTRICAELEEVVEAWGQMDPSDFGYYNLAREAGATHAQALEAVKADAHMPLYIERLRDGDGHDVALGRAPDASDDEVDQGCGA